MGINYYLMIKPDTKCPTCGHQEPSKEVHIGKSSFGWRFIFEPRYKSGKEWFSFLESQPYKICDEYGTEISLEDFKQMVLAKLNKRYAFDDWANYEYLDEDGHRISKREDFS